MNEVEKDKSFKSGHNSVKNQSNVSANKWSNVKDRESSNNMINQREKKGRQAKVTSETINDQQKQQDEYYQR